MQITHIRNKEIDFDKWDRTISNSTNKLVYAYSWYLNIVSPGWEALVSDNYEFIMPLPIKRKFGLTYLVQPVLTQQLGVFSINSIDENIIKQFVSKIPYYSYDLNLNEFNFETELIEMPNFVLNLVKDYSNISLNFNKNTQRNIDKAYKLNLSIHDEISIQDFFTFYTSVYILQSELLRIYELLVSECINYNYIQILGIKDATGTLVAALCSLVSENRIIYLLPVSNHEGKISSAMFMLVNEIIKKNAGKILMLDFEGSAIDGIARFYKGFGATYRPYYKLKRFRPDFIVGKI